MKLSSVVCLLLLSTSVWSAPVISITSTTAATLAATRNTVLAGQPFSIIEDFESYSTGNQGTNFATNIGTWTASGAGNTSGSCQAGCDELYVHSAATTPFTGRFNTTPGGAKWLDSNDMTSVILSVTPGLNNLFFFITDVQDQGGVLTITGNDGSTSALNFGGGQPNGSYFFVNITSASDIQSVTFSNTSRGDGYGVDDFGALDAGGPVPEPSTYAMVGGALGLLAWIRRRRAA